MFLVNQLFGCFSCQSPVGRLLGIALLLAGGLPLQVPGQDSAVNPIRLNTVGFLPSQNKRASIAAACTNFTVIRCRDGAEVFRGTISGPEWNPDTKENLCTADFSALEQAGTFQLNVPGVGRSPRFRIGADVYSQPYRMVMRSFYLWRCGMAVRGGEDGRTFAHEACHTNDAFLDLAGGGTNRLRPSLRGWHDAGDYNKYVVNAGVTVGTLLRAWEDFGGALKSFPLGLPPAEPALPEFLAEIKWELDWLLTMQAEDGAVYHKVSTRDFGGFIQPEEESAPRYFAPWSTESTANFVAMMAQAARHFRPYDAAFADRCAAAAEKSYQFLVAHPERTPSDQGEFSTGTYAVPDKSARLWAAAEMWQLTGRTNCLADFEGRLGESGVERSGSFDYGNPGVLGMLTYLFSDRAGRDPAQVERLRAGLRESAGEIVGKARAHGYARPFGSRYLWGGNGHVARQVVILRAAHRLDPRPEYLDTSLDALGHLFGRNVHGRSYVTGLGFQPPLHPHDRRSAGSENSAPWPGYLVGGPHPGAQDWQDETGDFRTNEIAINWNAALVYALAGFIAVPP